MKKIFFCITSLIAVASCTTYSTEYKQAQSENDSLRLLLTKNEVEMNDMLEMLNSIEEDISAIRNAEEYINIEKDAELSESRRARLQQNMDLIVETLRKN